MTNKHYLQIFWAKAFDEIYCHHAALFIPVPETSLFPPELINVGVNTRSKVLLKNKEKNIDKRIANFLPVATADGGLMIKLESSSIIDAISLNTWTTFKTGKRKSLKEFPLNIFYSIDGGNEITLPFNLKEKETPYLLFEREFDDLENGAMVETKIVFDL